MTTGKELHSRPARCLFVPLHIAAIITLASPPPLASCCLFSWIIHPAPHKTMNKSVCKFPTKLIY